MIAVEQVIWERLIMKTALVVPLTVASLVMGMFAAPISVRADGGGIAAGLLGGFAAGAVIGAATAPRYYAPGYYAPPPAYVVPAPDEAPPSCYWTHGAPVWDGYGWVHPRVQVCD
jgi:hypothetical protein